MKEISYTERTLHLLHQFSGPSCGTGQPILDLICNETIYLPMVMSYNNVLISSLFKTNAQFGIYNLMFDVIALEATRGFKRLKEWRERENKLLIQGLESKSVIVYQN